MIRWIAGAACLALACACGQTPRVEAPRRVAPSQAARDKTPLEIELARHAAELRAAFETRCRDACCADLPAAIAAGAGTSRRDVPEVELRELAWAADAEPLVRALAIAWLSARNDPRDLPGMAALGELHVEVPWFVRGAAGADGCDAIEWRRATLGAIALEAASHVAGRSFASRRDVELWMRWGSDARNSMSYWLAHGDQLEELWAWDPLRYLALALRPSRPANAPAPARSPAEIYAALRPRAAELVAMAEHGAYEWEPGDRARVLAFAAEHSFELGLEPFRDRWLPLWRGALEASDPAERETAVSLAVLAAAGGAGDDVLQQTFERAASTRDAHTARSVAPIVQARAARGDLSPWFARLDVTRRGVLLEALSYGPRPGLPSIAKTVILPLSEQELVEVLPDLVTLVQAADPTLVDPDARAKIMDAWSRQPRSGKLDPLLAHALDRIRSSARGW